MEVEGNKLFYFFNFNVKLEENEVYDDLFNTSFNPQNLRNTIKKFSKISIAQIIIIELVCQNNRISLFF